MANIGRPSKYTEELANEICIRLIAGESLRQVCSDPEMPDRQTILNWAYDNDTFSAKYARARMLQADAQFDDMQAVEARVLDGELEPNAGRTVLNNMQWRLSKLSRGRYGDKLDLTAKVTTDKQMTDAELMAIAAWATGGDVQKGLGWGCDESWGPTRKYSQESCPECRFANLVG